MAKKSHEYVPLFFLKHTVIHDFEKWCDEVDGDPSSLEDFFEYLIQRDFIQGKRFLDYIDDISHVHERDYNSIWFGLDHIQPLREGFLPPKTWIGPKT